MDPQVGWIFSGATRYASLPAAGRFLYAVVTAVNADGSITLQQIASFPGPLANSVRPDPSHAVLPGGGTWEAEVERLPSRYQSAYGWHWKHIAREDLECHIFGEEN